MEDVLVPTKANASAKSVEVLILVVVEDVLVLGRNGDIRHSAMCLNPCCSGRCSSTEHTYNDCRISDLVLILVVVEDVLVHHINRGVNKHINKS